MKSGEFDSSDINLKTWNTWMQERKKKGPRRHSRVGGSIPRNLPALRTSLQVPSTGARPSSITRNSIHSSFTSTNGGRDSMDYRSPPISPTSPTSFHSVNGTASRGPRGVGRPQTLSYQTHDSHPVIVVTPPRHKSMIGEFGNVDYEDDKESWSQIQPPRE
jgi:hypothetical protein